MYNILDGKAESDRVLYNDLDPDSGFMLLPDLKWNQSQLESLYVTGLIRQPIQSMRELRASHLPLLRKLATIGKVRMYVLYVRIYSVCLRSVCGMLMFLL